MLATANLAAKSPMEAMAVENEATTVYSPMKAKTIAMTAITV